MHVGKDVTTLEHLCITDRDIKSYSYSVKWYKQFLKKLNRITI